MEPTEDNGSLFIIARADWLLGKTMRQLKEKDEEEDEIQRVVVRVCSEKIEMVCTEIPQDRQAGMMLCVCGYRELTGCCKF